MLNNRRLIKKIIKDIIFPHVHNQILNKNKILMTDDLYNDIIGTGIFTNLINKLKSGTSKIKSTVTRSANRINNTLNIGRNQVNILINIIKNIISNKRYIAYIFFGPKVSSNAIKAFYVSGTIEGMIMGALSAVSTNLYNLVKSIYRNENLPIPNYNTLGFNITKK